MVTLSASAQVHRMEHRDSSMTERVYNLNPIVVTGSGHHQRLKSTTTPVSVLSAVEMKEQGITTLDLTMLVVSMMLLWLFSFTKLTIERWEGALLTTIFVAYLTYLVMAAV